MFVIDARDAARSLLSADWRLLTSVSFEPRWRGFVDCAAAEGVRPSMMKAILPIDSGSTYQEECTRRQKQGWIDAGFDRDATAICHELDMATPAPWRTVQSVVEQL